MPRIVTEKSAGVCIATFQNPPFGDMDPESEQALSALLDDVESDSSVRVVILTGAMPGVFIRHYDVGVLLERSQALAAREMQFDVARPVPESLIHQCLRRMETMPIPFIAAINGTAMGGGLEVALACDLRLVQAGNYDLGLPEVNLGLLAGAGGTQRMTRLLGQARALELQLLGKTLSPEQAVTVGLASECTTGDVLGRAMELAATLVEKSPAAVARIKGLIRGVGECSAEQGLANERTLFCDLMVSEQALSGMQSFLNGGGDIREGH